nr:unnamed protein product [Digitaria exilis]
MGIWNLDLIPTQPHRHLPPPTQLDRTDVLHVQAAKATKREHDHTKHLLGESKVSPLAHARRLPQPLPRLTHAADASVRASARISTSNNRSSPRSGTLSCSPSPPASASTGGCSPSPSLASGPDCSRCVGGGGACTDADAGVDEHSPAPLELEEGSSVRRFLLVSPEQPSPVAAAAGIRRSGTSWLKPSSLARRSAAACEEERGRTCGKQGSLSIYTGNDSSSTASAVETTPNSQTPTKLKTLQIWLDRTTNAPNLGTRRIRRRPPPIEPRHVSPRDDKPRALVFWSHNVIERWLGFGAPVGPTHATVEVGGVTVPHPPSWDPSVSLPGAEHALTPRQTKKRRRAQRPVRHQGPRHVTTADCLSCMDYGVIAMGHMGTPAGEIASQVPASRDSWAARDNNYNFDDDEAEEVNDALIDHAGENIDDIRQEREEVEP